MIIAFIFVVATAVKSAAADIVAAVFVKAVLSAVANGVVVNSY